MAAGPSLPDVNVLVALAWDSHIHHEPARRWFGEVDEWCTSTITEAGFVRVSAGPAIPAPITVNGALEVLRALTEARPHRFLPTEASMLARGMPEIRGHRQVTDAILIETARRAGASFVTFDAAAAELAPAGGAEVLRG